MAGLTTSYLLFLEAAKENGWPINDERFFRAVTVGFFAPDILRFELGDKQVGNIKSIGRRITHFCGGKMKYPRIEDLKDTILNHKEKFCARLLEENDNFRKVDPMIKTKEFLKENGLLFQGDIDNQVYAMGILGALIIDKRFDYVVQQMLFKFRGNKAIVRHDGPNKGKEYNDIRSILYKLYPRMDQQLIQRLNVNQDFFDRVYGILVDFYPSELLEEAFKPYWRIPNEKDLEVKKGHHKRVLSELFNQQILDWFYGNSISELSTSEESKSEDLDKIKAVVKNYKNANKKRPTAADFEISVSPERQAKVNLEWMPKAFAPQDTSRKSGKVYPTTE